MSLLKRVEIIVNTHDFWCAESVNDLNLSHVSLVLLSNVYIFFFLITDCKVQGYDENVLT